LDPTSLLVLSSKPNVASEAAGEGPCQWLFGVADGHKILGRKPVRFAIRDSMRCPISSSS
jgi:hypothetical protein